MPPASQGHKRMKNLKNKRVSFDPSDSSPNKEDKRLAIKRRLSSETSINGRNIDEKLEKKVFGKRNKVGLAPSIEVTDAE